MDYRSWLGDQNLTDQENEAEQLQKIQSMEPLKNSFSFSSEWVHITES